MYDARHSVGGGSFSTASTTAGSDDDYPLDAPPASMASFSTFCCKIIKCSFRMTKLWCGVVSCGVVVNSFIVHVRALMPSRIAFLARCE